MYITHAEKMARKSIAVTEALNSVCDGFSQEEAEMLEKALIARGYLIMAL